MLNSVHMIWISYFVLKKLLNMQKCWKMDGEIYLEVAKPAVDTKSLPAVGHGIFEGVCLVCVLHCLLRGPSISRLY